MATEYNDLDVQAANDVPGATYANQIRANQEALIEPPSCKWRGVAYLNAAWSQTITTASWARLTLLSVKADGDQPGVSAPQSSYLYQTDAGGSLSAGAEPWRSSANDTSSGTYSNVDSAGQTYSRSNAFKVPRNGVYLIGARCRFTGTAAAGNYYSLRILTSGADFQVDRATLPYVSGSIPVDLRCVGQTYLTTSDYFYVEAYNGDTFNANHEVLDVEMWAFRVSRTPTP